MNLGGPTDVLEYVPDCKCASCIQVEKLAERERGGDLMNYLCRFYVFCPDCGNKRCPKATHHGYACTGSNKSGQPGSWY